MQIVDRDSLFLEGDDGEKITVSIQSKNTVHMVTYVLDGTQGSIPQGKTLTFSLKKSKADPSKLTLVLHYVSSSPSQNGAYRVQVTGSNGGDTFIKAFSQSFGIPVDVKQYTIDVW